jgi:hypothetical protein
MLMNKGFQRFFLLYNDSYLLCKYKCCDIFFKK